MNADFAIIIGVFAALCAGAALVLSLLLIREKKYQRKLTRDIENYLDNGAAIDFSTKEGSSATLRNAVSELQSAAENQKRLTAEANRKNSQFISDISHQLKTPLAGLRLYCEMAQNSQGCAYADKELVLIERMEQLVARLITLEKISSDTYRMDFEDCSLSELGEPLAADFRRLFPKKSISFSASGSLRCSREWLSQAIGNVIKNACEHTPEDGRVCISFKADDSSALISVSDNGGGIAEEELPLIFERFHRAQNALPSSAGIGLAVTKAVVEKHHGTVSAENIPGGLQINICIPKIDCNISF